MGRNDTYEACLKYIEKHSGKTNNGEGSHRKGLLDCRELWERRSVDIFVGGNMFTGIPIFTDEHTLRVVNDDYTYFIPIEKIDCIRTRD